MSALALPALALAARAARTAAAPALFADLAARVPAPDAGVLVSSGHGAVGRGGGTYVADALCDAGLLAAHPTCVFAAADGRIFRLLPERGAIAAEQAGAVGGGAANDQPAIQAAIDYAEAVGAGEVRFEQAHYRLDCPVRTAPLADTRAENGHPLVVRRSLRLSGAAGTRTVLDFRGQDGTDPDTGFQTVAAAASDPAPAVWRGGGLFVQGDAADPAPAAPTIARLELDRLVLRGNRRRTGNHAFPADPATGDGWDVSDKALWVQDCFVGDIVCRDTDMIGWRGEILYFGGAANAVRSLTLDRCRLATSNGSAMNPACDAAVTATDCQFGDCFQAQEEVWKSAARYRNCTWHDCDHMSLGCGPSQGRPPVRAEGRPVPATVLEDCRFERVGALRIGAFVAGRVTTVDSSVVLDGPGVQALGDVDLAIEAVLDGHEGRHAVELYGPDAPDIPLAGGGGTIQPPRAVRIVCRLRRTAAAIAAGRQWLGAFWTGYVDRSCVLAVTGDCAGGRQPNGGPDPLSMPRVTWSQGEATTRYWPRGWYRLPILGGSGQVAPCAPAMTLEPGSDAVMDVELTRTPRGGTEFGYADGQRIEFVKGGPGAVRFVKGAAPGTAVRETRVLASPYDRIAFTYNADWRRWEEDGFFAGP